MKKYIFLFLGILLFTLSCTKEEDKYNANENQDNKLKDYLYNELDPIEAKILQFINRMDLVRENPEYPESEQWNYSRDSTVWYLEAVLNYQYSYIWQYSGYDDLSVLYNMDSSFTTVNSNDEGDFNIVELQQCFDALSNSLQSQYLNVEAESKFFVLSDIVDQGIENENLALMQYSIIGKANQEISSTDWRWGLGMGDCSGNNLGIDATDIIEYKLSLYRYTAQGLVYLNIGPAQTLNNGDIIPNDVPLPSSQGNPTQFWDYLLFNYTDQYGHPCLSNADINWYRDNILMIEGTYTPAEKDIIFTDVKWDLTSSIPYSQIRHIIYPLYGEAHIFQYPEPID